MFAELSTYRPQEPFVAERIPPGLHLEDPSVRKIQAERNRACYFQVQRAVDVVLGSKDALPTYMSEKRRRRATAADQRRAEDTNSVTSDVMPHRRKLDVHRQSPVSTPIPERPCVDVQEEWRRISYQPQLPPLGPPPVRHVLPSEVPVPIPGHKDYIPHPDYSYPPLSPPVYMPKQAAESRRRWALTREERDEEDRRLAYENRDQPWVPNTEDCFFAYIGPYL